MQHPAQRRRKPPLDMASFSSINLSLPSPLTTPQRCIHTYITHYCTQIHTRSVSTPMYDLSTHEPGSRDRASSSTLHSTCQPSILEPAIQPPAESPRPRRQVETVIKLLRRLSWSRPQTFQLGTRSLPPDVETQVVIMILRHSS